MTESSFYLISIRFQSFQKHLISRIGGEQAVSAECHPCSVEQYIQVSPVLQTCTKTPFCSWTDIIFEDNSRERLDWLNRFFFYRDFFFLVQRLKTLSPTRPLYHLYEWRSSVHLYSLQVLLTMIHIRKHEQHSCKQRASVMRGLKLYLSVCSYLLSALFLHVLPPSSVP